jgi:uncharacterized protein (UPF0332 family)
MAWESFQAAEAAHSADHHRVAVSRHYYAAYQAATALLHYGGQMPPIVEGERREAWSHVATPDMLEEHLQPALRRRDQRRRMRSTLRDLYRARVEADYIASLPLAAGRAQELGRRARWFLRMAREILPPESR